MLNGGPLTQLMQALAPSSHTLLKGGNLSYDVMGERGGVQGEGDARRKRKVSEEEESDPHKFTQLVWGNIANNLSRNQSRKGWKSSGFQMVNDLLGSLKDA